MQFYQILPTLSPWGLHLFRLPPPWMSASLAGLANTQSKTCKKCLTILSMIDEKWYFSGIFICITLKSKVKIFHVFKSSFPRFICNISVYDFYSFFHYIFSLFLLISIAIWMSDNVDLMAKKKKNYPK